MARNIEARIDRGVFFDNRKTEQTTFHESLDCYHSEISFQKSIPRQDLQHVKQSQCHPLARRYLANVRGTDFAKDRHQRRAAGRAEYIVRLKLSLIGHL